MKSKLSKASSAIEILRNYKGLNSYIINLRNEVFVYNKTALSDFNVEYILTNYEKEPEYLNKIIKISRWYGEKKQQEWGLDFTPEKLLVGYYLGETTDFYHMFVKYRKSQEKMIPIFIPKKALLNPLFIENFEDKVIDFEKYNKMGNIILKPQQEQGVKFLTTRKKAILAHQMGGGKEIDINTIIPTPNGWVKADDIQVGDYLFASNGKPTQVIGKYYQGIKDIYEVEFSDGLKVNCGLDHLWIARNTFTNNKKWRTVSLREILEEGLHSNPTKNQIKYGWSLTNKWQIPMCKPVEYGEKKFFIDPYTLGMLIGDGSLCNGKIMISIPEHEKESVDRIKNTLVETYTLKGNFYANCHRYSIIRKDLKKGAKNDYIQEINRLGLNVIGYEKFIPEEYLMGSIEQRISLLQGLMDSDGYISEKGNRLSFTSTSIKLINDVKLLIESLGGKCTKISEDKRKNKYKKSCYKLRFQIRINPFRLKHKAERYTIDETHTKYCNRRIKNVEKVRRSEAVCFAVDSEDHSFLTEHYVVTHNTITSIVAALEENFDKILVICPASVKVGWFDEINRFVDKEDIVIVEGSKWKDSKFTIINYDILDNFYEIPTETVKKRTRMINENGNVIYRYVEKEVVSKDNNVISEAMENSQLFQSKFDLIIIDEAHKLSNNKSIRYKIISDLIKRSNPKGIYELTGTMITNNPMNLYHILKIIDAEITKDWQSYVITYCDGKQIYVKSERDKITNGFLRSKRKSSWYDLTIDERNELNLNLEKNCKKIWLTKGSSNLDELREKIKHLYLRDLNEEIYKNFSKETKIINYELSTIEKIEYDKAWDEYVANQEGEKDVDKLLDNKKLIESSVLRQTTSLLMIPHTIKLVNEIIERGEKVIVFCAFDNEIYSLKEHFKDKCVIHNGKLTLKEKTKVLKTFNEDDNVQILLGNLTSTSVGLNLCIANNIVFNSVSWLPAENQQAEYRILRIGQDKDCHIYYQCLLNTYMEKMFNILDIKNEIINNVIVDEKNK